MSAPIKGLEQFKDEQKRTKYKHISLLKGDGSCLIKFNSQAKDFDSRFDEIQKRLQSSALLDGIYILAVKHSPRRDAVADEFQLIKGKPNLSENTTTSVQPTKTPKENPTVTSYSEVLKLEVELNKLRLENETLKKENERLTKENSELETENANLNSQLDELEGQEGLSEGTGFDSIKTWLNDAFQMVSPLIDKHYELKEHELKLKTMIYARSNGMATPKFETKKPAQEKPPGSEAVEYTNKKIIEYIEQQETKDPELFELMAGIYNNAKSFDDLVQTLKDQMSEEKFVELSNFINSK